MTNHTELADTLANISMLLREARHIRHLSTRAAGEQLGMSFATVSRIEGGKDHMLSKTIAILRWLDDPTGVCPICAAHNTGHGLAENDHAS
jgi:hypothetical protein